MPTRTSIRRIITSVRRVLFVALFTLSALCGQAAADCDTECLSGFNRCKAGCPADDAGACAAGCFVQAETCFDACKVSVGRPADGEPKQQAQEPAQTGEGEEQPQSGQLGEDEMLRKFAQARAAEEQRKFAQAKEQEEREKTGQAAAEEPRQAEQSAENGQDPQAGQAGKAEEPRQAEQSAENGQDPQAGQAGEAEASRQTEEAEETEEEKYRKAFVQAAQAGDCNNFCRDQGQTCLETCRDKIGESRERCIHNCVSVTPSQCFKACAARQNLEQGRDGQRKE